MCSEFTNLDRVKKEKIKDIFMERCEKLGYKIIEFQHKYLDNTIDIICCYEDILKQKVYNCIKIYDKDISESDLSKIIENYRTEDFSEYTDSEGKKQTMHKLDLKIVSSRKIFNEKVLKEVNIEFVDGSILAKNFYSELKVEDDVDPSYLGKIIQLGTIHVLGQKVEIEKIYIPLLGELVEDEGVNEKVESSKKDTKKEIVILDNILNRFNDKKVIIFGSSGYGKTVFLKYLAYKSVKFVQNLDQDIRELPVLVYLKTFTESKLSLRDYIKNLIGCKEECLERIKERIILLIDEYDKLIKKEKMYVHNEIHEFINNSNCSIIIVSRLSEVYNEFSNFALIEILDLNYDQMNSYIQKWFDMVNEQKNEYQKVTFQNRLRAQSNIREIVRNPLMLSILIEIWKKKDYIPTVPSELLQEYVNIILENDRDRKIEVLEILAEKSMDSEKFSLNEAIGWVSGQYNIEEQIILDNEFLTKVDRKEIDSQYTFEQSYFRDYFLAQKLIREEDGGLTKVIEKLYEPKWEDVILFYAGNKEQGINVIRKIEELEMPKGQKGDLKYQEDIFHTNLIIKGKCSIGLQDDKYALGINIQLYKKYKESRSGMRFLQEKILNVFSYTKPQDVIDEIEKEYFQDNSMGLQKSGIKILSEIGTKKANDVLIAKLKEINNNTYIRQAIIESLGKIGIVDSVTTLEEIIKENSWIEKAAAVQALGKIGCNKSVEILSKIIDDTVTYDPSLIESAIIGLGYLENRDIVEKLYFIIESEKHSLRSKKRAIKTLENRIILPRDKNIIEKLIEIYKDDVLSSSIQTDLIEMFGEVDSGKSNEVIQEALKNCSSSNTALLEKIIIALGKIDINNETEELLMQMYDSTYKERIKNTIMDTIGNKGNKKGKDFLWQKFNEKSNSDIIRSKAIEGLTKNIDTEHELNRLKQILLDEKEICAIRSKVAEVFGIMKKKEVTDDLLNIICRETEGIYYSSNATREDILDNTNVIKFVKDQPDKKGYYLLWSKVVEALGNIGEERAFKPICKLIDNTNDKIMLHRAIEAMGKIVNTENKQEIVAYLVELYKKYISTDKEICEKILSSLETIKKQWGFFSELTREGGQWL